jgi:hypothetical protein
MTQIEKIESGAIGGLTLPGASSCRRFGAFASRAFWCRRAALRKAAGDKVRWPALRLAGVVLALPLFGIGAGAAAEPGEQALMQTPVAWASLEVSRRADRIVTAAPGFLSVTTTGEQNRLRGVLQADMTRLEAGLKDLRRIGAADPSAVAGQAEAMMQLADQFADSLEVLDRTASARLFIHHLKAEGREAAGAAQREIAARLRPWAEETAAAVEALRDALGDDALEVRRRLKISDALVEAALLQRHIGRALERSAQAELALAVVACCAPQDRLPDIRPMVEAAVADLKALAPAMATAGMPSLAQPIAVLRRVGLGPQSLFNLRQIELRMQDVAEAALARNRELAEAFSDRVDSLVLQVRAPQSAAK